MEAEVTVAEVTEEVAEEEVTAAEEEAAVVAVAQEGDRWKCTKQLVPIAANLVKYLSDLAAISRFFAAIVSKAKMVAATGLIEEVEISKDVIPEEAAAEEATATVIIPTGHRWKCIRLFVPTAAEIAKYHSNLPATNRFSVINVLVKTRKSRWANLPEVMPVIVLI